MDAEETGKSQLDIRYRCIALKVTPIKKRDQAIQLIKAHCYTKTPEEIAKKGLRLTRTRKLKANSPRMMRRWPTSNPDS